MNANVDLSKPDSVWQNTLYTNLIRYQPPQIYFARFRVKGKLIRRSLKTNHISVATLRLADLEKVEQQKAHIAFHIDIGTYGDKLTGMKAYALDLRERVVKFIAGGGSKAEAARRFDLARSSVYRYLVAAQNGRIAPENKLGHLAQTRPGKTPRPRQKTSRRHPQRTPSRCLASAITRSGCGWGSWASR